MDGYSRTWSMSLPGKQPAGLLTRVVAGVVGVVVIAALLGALALASGVVLVIAIVGAVLFALFFGAVLVMGYASSAWRWLRTGTADPAGRKNVRVRGPSDGTGNGRDVTPDEPGPTPPGA